MPFYVVKKLKMRFPKFHDRKLDEFVLNAEKLYYFFKILFIYLIFLLNESFFNRRALKWLQSYLLYGPDSNSKTFGEIQRRFITTKFSLKQLKLPKMNICNKRHQFDMKALHIGKSGCIDVGWFME